MLCTKINFRIVYLSKSTKHCLAGCQIDIGENENKLFNRMNFFQFKWKIVL